MPEITENIYSKIFGMAPSEQDFYFLTSGSLYRSSYDTGLITKLSDTSGENKIIAYKDNNIILWSNADKMPVVQKDLDKKSTVTLFTPKNTSQNVRLCTVGDSDYLVEVESNSTVNLYNFKNKTYKEIYSGTGIQDAVLMDNGLIYIAKSAATNPQTPLLSVNPETMETVPLSIKGNVTYALSTDGKTIYGLNIISDDCINFMMNL